jgi:hypothetical protein
MIYQLMNVMLVQLVILFKENRNIKQLVIISIQKNIIYMFINLFVIMEIGIIGQWLKFKNTIVKIIMNYLNMKDNGLKH